MGFPPPRTPFGNRSIHTFSEGILAFELQCWCLGDSERHITMEDPVWRGHCAVICKLGGIPFQPPSSPYCLDVSLIVRDKIGILLKIDKFWIIIFLKYICFPR